MQNSQAPVRLQLGLAIIFASLRPYKLDGKTTSQTTGQNSNQPAPPTCRPAAPGWPSSWLPSGTSHPPQTPAHPTRRALQALCSPGPRQGTAAEPVGAQGGQGQATGASEHVRCLLDARVHILHWLINQGQTQEAAAARGIASNRIQLASHPRACLRYCECWVLRRQLPPCCLDGGRKLDGARQQQPRAALKVVPATQSAQPTGTLGRVCALSVRMQQWQGLQGRIHVTRLLTLPFTPSSDLSFNLLRHPPDGAHQVWRVSLDVHKHVHAGHAGHVHGHQAAVPIVHQQVGACSRRGGGPGSSAHGDLGAVRGGKRLLALHRVLPDTCI